MQTSMFPSVRALDQLLDGLGVGAARRRQLDMVRGELERALDRGALPIGARRSLQRLLEEETLAPYVRLAESGTLRHRQVAGGFPPTSEATNEIRRKCLDLLRKALGLLALHLGGGEIPLQPAPEAATLSALARQLDRYLAGTMSPTQTRLTALLALELDTAARSGELVGLRTTHLGKDYAAVYIERRPQGGGAIEREWVETSALSRAALARWMDERRGFVQRAHGTSKLWVSLWMNHDGVFDNQGNTTIRPPGMPLEENGLITSYRVGRLRYDGLRQLLPLKLEALRRAVDAERRRTAV